LVQKAFEAAGRIDVLVNNAGIAGPIDWIENIDLKGWNETIAVNLSGMFLCCKYTIPIMKKQKGGAIVNIASITGKNPLPQRVPYATTKMGVIGLTRTLAAEVGAYRIRVNAICPGSVTGDRQKIVFEGIAKFSGKSYETVVEERLQTTPLRSLIDPEHVASVVSFLCSDDAAMMTGQDVNVTGGRIMF
jgi:NAD(P)-dependent dehydrogenase (short-subunit alcohol dehydrogenase family)